MDERTAKAGREKKLILVQNFANELLMHHLYSPYSRSVALFLELSMKVENCDVKIPRTQKKYLMPSFDLSILCYYLFTSNFRR
jgi:hypothetical protein